MHVKTAADSSQLCQHWLGCSAQSASDRALPLSWKWKIPLQIPHTLLYPTQPQAAKKLQPSSRNGGRRSTTLALQNTVVLKKTHTQIKSQSTLPGCTAASLRYANTTQTNLWAKKTCVMQHNSVSKDTHGRISSSIAPQHPHQCTHSSSPFESFVAIKREIWGFPNPSQPVMKW